MNDSPKASGNPINVKCPHCGTSVAWTESSPYRPFCSARCQLVDLGQWATESYRIPEVATAARIEAMSDEELESFIEHQAGTSGQIH